MPLPLLDSSLVAWHPSEPRLLLGVPDGVACWVPEGAVRTVSGVRAVTVGWWGERVVATDEEGGVEVDGIRFDPRLGRIDALAEGPELGLVGDLFGALGSGGARRFAYLPPAGSPLWAAWTGEGWMVRHESGVALLDPDGAVIEERPLARDDRVRWQEGLRVHRLPPTDPFARTHTLVGDTLVAEGREHVLYVQRGDELTAVPGHPRTVTAIGIAPDGRVVTGCRDGVVRCYDGALTALDAPGRAERFAWSADGRWWVRVVEGRAEIAPWPPRARSS